MTHQSCSGHFKWTSMIPIALAAMWLSAGVRAAEVVVDAGVAVGSSNEIERVLAVEGGPLGESRFETRAWTALGIENYINLFDEPGGTGMHVTRGSAPPGGLGPLGPDGDLYLDARDFDSNIRAIAGMYHFTPRVLSASMMPRVLSLHPELEDFATYAPRSDAEWNDVIQAAVRHLLESLRITDPIIQVSSEPESANWIWNGRNKDDPAAQKLGAYVDFFIVTWYAVEAANSAARTVGPTTAVYSSALAREISGIPDVWGMEEFLALLGQHNLANPDNPVVLECVAWQGYDWLGTRRLREGVSFVQSELEKNGFSRDTPQIIIGWNAQWATGQIPLWFEASHFASNAIDLLNPGGERVVERMYFYTWNLDDEPCDGQGQRNYASLVDTIHPRFDYGGNTCIPASEVEAKRPGYAAMEALHSMLGGRFLLTSVGDVGPEEGIVDAMTTLHGTKTLRVLFANNSDADSPITLRISRLPWRPGTRVNLRVQRIDGSHSVDGRGLERGATFNQLRVASDRSLTIPSDKVGTLQTRSVELLTIQARR